MLRKRNETKQRGLFSHNSLPADAQRQRTPQKAAPPHPPPSRAGTQLTSRCCLPRAWVCHSSSLFTGALHSVQLRCPRLLYVAEAVKGSRELRRGHPPLTGRTPPSSLPPSFPHTATGQPPRRGLGSPATRIFGERRVDPLLSRLLQLLLPHEAPQLFLPHLLPTRAHPGRRHLLPASTAQGRCRPLEGGCGPAPRRHARREGGADGKHRPGAGLRLGGGRGQKAQARPQRRRRRRKRKLSQ